MRKEWNDFLMHTSIRRRLLINLFCMSARTHLTCPIGMSYPIYNKLKEPLHIMKGKNKTASHVGQDFYAASDSQ